ncbi:hypothetical protein H2248_001696 [Termitomyces sp. 'cryptogamus']|nr:hypothetical protein H2248_001696 [Termitomyces sp. 'cryptogamus']
MHIQHLEHGIAFAFVTNTLSTFPDYLDKFANCIHDCMTQVYQITPLDEDTIFAKNDPHLLHTVDLKTSSKQDGTLKERLMDANKHLGLVLASDEIDYLVNAYITGPTPINHNPSNTKLFMFTQVNSEHCQHKIFNASWMIDRKVLDKSLFQMIHNTEKISGTGTISAYSDNTAILYGHSVQQFS